MSIKGSKPKVLIMIPALNEEKIIGRLIHDIHSRFPEFSLLVINDGSTDNTGQEARDAGADVISLPYNLGIGGAVQTGFRFAHKNNFDIAVQLDGDAQHDPAFLTELIAPVLEGEADLCIGSRFLSDQPGYRSTFTRRIGIRFFSLLLGILTGVNLTDPTSGFRAVSKKLIQKFSHHYPVDFPEPEVIQSAKRYGARIKEIPVRMRKRLGGRSSIRYFATIYYMVKVTLAILIDTVKQKDKETTHES